MYQPPTIYGCPKGLMIFSDSSVRLEQWLINDIQRCHGPSDVRQCLTPQTTGGCENVMDSDIRVIELSLNRFLLPGFQVSSQMKNVNVIGNHHLISMVQNQTGPNLVERT